MTKRTVSMERTYAVGNYQNIKLYDSMVDLPEEVAMDNEIIMALRFLQIVQSEKTYYEYQKLRKNFANAEVTAEDAIEHLTRLHEETVLKLQELFKNNPIESKIEKV